MIKMNIDTDTQWAYWDGLRAFEADKHDYLQSQIGNPDGADKPNKKYYDPRVWIRKAEESMMARVGVSMEKLGSVGKYTRSTEAGSDQCTPQFVTKEKSYPIIYISFGLLVAFTGTVLLKKKK